MPREGKLHNAGKQSAAPASGVATRRERGLAKHLQTLENLIGAIGTGVVVADTHGRFVQFNEAARNILGIGETARPPEEWAGHYGLFDADGVTPLSPGESPLERAMSGETVIEAVLFIRNGERPDGVWCRVSAAPLVDDYLLGGIVIFTDITDQKRALQSLQESEHRLRTVVDTAADAIITIDRHGIIQMFNRAAEEMFGYDANEAVGQNIRMLMPSPYRDRHDENLARHFETGEAHIIGIGREIQGKRKDGTLVPMHLSVSEVDHLGLFTGVLHNLTESKALQEEIVDIAAKERKRIGEDLHDGLGQELTGLGLVIDGLAQQLSSPEVAQSLAEAGLQDVQDRFAELKAATRKARDDLRHLARGLVALPIDEGGLAQAIRDLATTMDDWNDVDCAAVVDDAVQVGDPAVAAHVYRIAQEATGNALKHSQADTIRIILRSENGACVLEVVDNGVGIAPEKANPRGGIGLRIMDHRARLIGATLSIGPRPEGGTSVRCTFHDAPQNT